MALLEVGGVTKQFGGLVALNDVSFSVEQGEIHGLIGPNGAGKSTLFKIIAGFYRPTRGEVFYEGNTIAGLAPHRAAEMGVVRTFQETMLFQEMTVFDNVLVGCHLRARSGLFSALFGRDRDKRTRAAEKTCQVL